MIDASVENESIQTTNEITLAAIKDFLFSKGGKVRYSELFDHFREQIVDSTTDIKFQEFLSNLATRKYENDSIEEWIILKKVFYKEQSIQSNSTSSPNTGFFASKLQKTKQSLTKFSNTLIYQNSKEKFELANKSLNSSSNSLNSCSSSHFQSSTTSYSSSNLTDLNEFHGQNSQTAGKRKAPKFNTVQSTFFLNNVPNNNLSSSSRAKSSLEIFESDNLLSNISLSKNVSNEELKNSETSIDEKSNPNETILFGVKSVKEHAKKLNRLNTQMELSLTSTPTRGTPKKSSLSKESAAVPFKHIDLETFDLADPQSTEKEWIIICSRCEYMEIAKYLLKHPYLAQKKDPFTGYTCAHWACKYGHIEVLKLIASTLENDKASNPKSIRIKHLINNRTRAGYTCLHIAYIFKHSDLAPILKGYGAEGLIDYSGRQAIDYSEKQQDKENFNRTPQFDILELYSSDSSRKSSTNDSGSGLDISSIVKRTSSILLKDNKDKSNYSKPRSSTLQQPRSNTLQRVTDTSSIAKSQMLPPSPLASIEPCQNNKNAGFLHPSVMFRNNKDNKPANSEDIYQNDETNEESKENIFI